jgi:hypothetical protein
MENGNQRLRLGLALATVISAIAVPTASAAPIGEPLGGTDAQDYTAVPVSWPAPSPEAASVPGDGFDWGDAGIGAGGMLALTAIAGGVVLALGSRRSRHGVA